MRRPPCRRLPARERGLVLIAVLVVLAALLLAGAAAMRSVDTGNVIAGNHAFQQAAAQAADRPVSDAMSTLAGLVVGTGGNTAISHRYFSTRQADVDDRGMPSAIDWAAVSCTDPTGAVIADCDQDNGQYRVQYVIERLCSANPDLSNVADIRARCEYEASATALSAASIALRYRVMVRVRGPRGTEAWFEAVVSGPAAT